MANIAVAFSFLIVAINAYQFIGQYGLVSRSFYALGPHLIENAVTIPRFDTEAESPSFDQARLKQIVVVYLTGLLIPELKQFTVGFYYYDPVNSMVCLADCLGVTIELSAPLVMGYDYRASLSFEITPVPQS